MLADALGRLAKVWDRDRSRAVISFKRDQSIHWVGFHGDERLIFVVSRESIMVHASDDGRKIACVKRGKSEASLAFAVHPSGGEFVVGSATGDLRICDAATFEGRNSVFTQRGAFHDLLGTPEQKREQMASSMAALYARIPRDISPEEQRAWLARQNNPERFSKLRFSADGEWMATASNFGLRVWRWEQLQKAGLGAAPTPVHSCPARPGPTLGHLTNCYTVVFDNAAQRVIFAGLEGIVELLDLRTERVVTLLRPPEVLAIIQLELSPDRLALAVQAREFFRNSPRRCEFRLWNYPELCRTAGLDF